MSRLFVIENGFDLWHGLPTGYSHFYQENEEYLDALNWYFSGVDDGNLTPWYDFEKNLGSYCWKSFYAQYNHIDVKDDELKSTR